MHYVTEVPTDEVPEIIRFQAQQTTPHNVVHNNYLQIDGTSDYVVDHHNNHFAIVVQTDDGGECWTHGEYHSVEQVESAIEEMLDL